MIKGQFLIWAAGFFDGEGCVMVAKAKNVGNVEWPINNGRRYRNGHPIPPEVKAKRSAIRDRLQALRAEIRVSI